jgi:hypothetical protein
MFFKKSRDVHVSLLCRPEIVQLKEEMEHIMEEKKVTRKIHNLERANSFILQPLDYLPT